MQVLTSSGNITNTGTGTLLSGAQTAGSGNITLQAVITKVSGTVAGTAQPQGSLDGANWVNLPSASAFTMTDVASQTQIWWLQNVRAIYYRILFTGSGTMVATPTGSLVTDQH